jgi:hypothetical protein
VRIVGGFFDQKIRQDCITAADLKEFPKYQSLGRKSSSSGSNPGFCNALDPSMMLYGYRRNP